MSVPADDTEMPDGKPAAAHESPVASKDGETKELTPDELQQISGGNPKAVDWIQAPA
jgi:bacteriocin-like protein